MKYIILSTETSRLPSFRQSEVVELAAVKVNPLIGKTGKILSEFQVFVKPQLSQTISADCTKITGITHTDVSLGVTLPEAMGYLWNWINEYDEYVVCTWGDVHRQIILRNYSRLGLNSDHVKLWFKKRVNLKRQFSYVLNCRSCGIIDALGMLEHSFTGRPHRAIDSAVNVSKVFSKLFRDWRLGHE